MPQELLHLRRPPERLFLRHCTRFTDRFTDFTFADIGKPGIGPSDEYGWYPVQLLWVQCFLLLEVRIQYLYIGAKTRLEKTSLSHIHTQILQFKFLTNSEFQWSIRQLCLWDVIRFQMINAVDLFQFWNVLISSSQKKSTHVPTKTCFIIVSSPIFNIFQPFPAVKATKKTPFLLLPSREKT